MTQLVARPDLPALPIASGPALSMVVPDTTQFVDVDSAPQRRDRADRWNRWIAKGIRHDDAVRGRFQMSACVAVMVAFAWWLVSAM